MDGHKVDKFPYLPLRRGNSGHNAVLFIQQKVESIRFGLGMGRGKEEEEKENIKFKIFPFVHT